MQENPRRAFIALGSNVGDSAQILRDALAELRTLSTEPVLCSSFWRTSPVDCPPGSPDFINAVCRIVPLLSETPETLLRKLQAMEQRFGRRPKTVLNEPRPLDLDLLAFDEVLLNTPELTLPHPRAHLRQFVMRPWNEIAPEYLLPVLNQRVAEVAQRLSTDEKITRLD